MSEKNVINLLTIGFDKEKINQWLNYISDSLEINYSYRSSIEDFKEGCVVDSLDIVMYWYNKEVEPNGKNIRAIQSVYPNIKLIILTKEIKVEEMLEFIRMGASAIISPTYSLRDIQDVFENVLDFEVYLTPFQTSLLLKAVHKSFIERERTEKRMKERVAVSNDLIGVQYGLTNAERSILTALLDGNGNDDIAVLNRISLSTVKNHILNISRKLNLNSKNEIIHFALTHNIVSYEFKN